MTPLQRVGGRKFLAALLSLASATALVWFGHISDQVYGFVLSVTVTAFITGNVWQKAVTKDAP